MEHPKAQEPTESECSHLAPSLAEKVEVKYLKMKCCYFTLFISKHNDGKSSNDKILFKIV